MSVVSSSFFVFFFNDTATTEIYTLSLHDALPISKRTSSASVGGVAARAGRAVEKRTSTSSHASPVRCHAVATVTIDRKSTRLNSSHANISYAVFCLKKKK